MNKPHKYADVVKAWAEGAKVQWAHQVTPTHTDPLAQLEPAWLDWVEDRNGAPSFSDGYLWRVKPKPTKWLKERAAHSRGKRVQWRSTSLGQSSNWHDMPIFMSDDTFEAVFNEPTNVFRIPHKWQNEIDAQASGEAVECSYNDGKTWIGPYPRAPWSFDDPGLIYRIKPKPKTVKTSIRTAVMGYPEGEGEVWTWHITKKSGQALVEANKHFLCWLHAWKEIERPVFEEKPAGMIWGASTAENRQRADDLNRKMRQALDACSTQLEQAKILRDHGIGCLPAGSVTSFGCDLGKPGGDESVWIKRVKHTNPLGFSWHTFETFDDQKP